MLNVTMHWYGFHTFTMRLSFSSGDETRYVESSPSHLDCSAASAAATCSGLENAAISASARFLLMTSGFSHFSSLGFSMYPSTKTSFFSSPGASFTSMECEATGDQPLATEFFDLPESTTSGSWNPL